MEGFIYKGPQQIITNGRLYGVDAITRSKHPDEKTVRIFLKHYAVKVMGLVFGYLLDEDRARVEFEDQPDPAYVPELPNAVRGRLPDQKIWFFGTSYNPVEALEEEDAWMAWKQLSQTIINLDLELLESIWNGYGAFEHIVYREGLDDQTKLVFVEAPPVEQTGADLLEMFREPMTPEDYPYVVLEHCKWLGLLPLLGIH